MNSEKDSGKSKFYKGLLGLIWAELKTINFEKIRSLSKLAIAYMFMKLAKKREDRNRSLPSH